jgi:hypothetical protein
MLNHAVEQSKHLHWMYKHYIRSDKISMLHEFSTHNAKNMWP